MSDTNQKIYKHDPIGLGDVDFAALPAVLAEIGHEARPMLEVISSDADRDIDDSVAKLVAMQWGRKHHE